MAKIEYQGHESKVTVEITDLHLVIIVLGLTAAGLTLVYMGTRNPETLRRLAEIAREKNAVLVEKGRRVFQ